MNNGNHWSAPTPVWIDVRGVDLLPTRDEIPAEFFDGHNEFHKAVQLWMSTGVKVRNVKGTIKAAVAVEHLTAAYSAHGVGYDHRVAGCAYLLSLWTRPPRSAAPVCTFCHGGPAVPNGTVCEDCLTALGEDPVVSRTRGANDAF